jgi:hypothetical protein
MDYLNNIKDDFIVIISFGVDNLSVVNRIHLFIFLFIFPNKFLHGFKKISTLSNLPPGDEKVLFINMVDIMFEVPADLDLLASPSSQHRRGVLVSWSSIFPDGIQYHLALILYSISTSLTKGVELIERLLECDLGVVVLLRLLQQLDGRCLCFFFGLAPDLDAFYALMLDSGITDLKCSG